MRTLRNTVVRLGVWLEIVWVHALYRDCKWREQKLARVRTGRDK